MNKNQVLIVDDNPNMSALLSDMLDVFDFSSEQAVGGVQALEMLSKGEFSMVITDLRMPEMSGSQLLQTIKEKYPGLPVIVISGYNLAEEEDTMLAELADEFINKPFRMDDIERVLQKFFNA
ncbi:MAG: response regulator [candidate division Zixibacteria bacterium]|nr:response regulator [candidate division Zixibacteria bacterium]MBU1470938.1 response regulator [candidate division Zixibacteria bacterium]MBU2625453.1 response regulator [candidate division Zixibacteria bacterium]